MAITFLKPWWALRLISAVVVLRRAAALDNGLGLVPVMGYNTWYDFGCNLDQAELELTVKAMHTTGLVALGYTYFDLDDWYATRTAAVDGLLIVSVPPKPPNAARQRCSCTRSIVVFNL